MSIETAAAKQGLKLGARIANIFREWRTRLAWKRNAKKRPSVSVRLSAWLLVALAASGCASLDNSYIAMDERLFDGSQNPGRYLVPDGYEVQPYVRNASGDRVDVTGWTVEEEMVKANTWTPRPLTIDSRGRAKASAINDLIKVAQEQAAGGGVDSSGAQSAIDALKSEAEKAGVK